MTVGHEQTSRWLAEYVDKPCLRDDPCLRDIIVYYNIRIEEFDMVRMCQIFTWAKLDDLINPDHTPAYGITEDISLLGGFMGISIYALRQNDHIAYSWEPNILSNWESKDDNEHIIILTRNPSGIFRTPNDCGVENGKSGKIIGLINYNDLYDITDEYIKLRDDAKETLIKMVKSLSEIEG